MELNSNRTRLSWINWLELILAFSIGAFGVALILFSGSNLPGADPYYHIQFAKLMKTHGFILEFPWCQASLFQRSFSDKEFLFHILLIPFTWGNLIYGSKIAGCVFAGVLFAVFDFLLIKQKVIFRIVWVLALFCSAPIFIYRISLLRPHLLSLLLLLTATHFFINRWYLRSALLAFIYSLSYSIAHLILLFALLFNLGLILSRKPIDFKILIFTSVGCLCGFIFHPYFPNNLVVWYVQSFLAPYYGWGISGVDLKQGMELLPPSGRNILFGMTVPIMAFSLAVFGFLTKGKRPSDRTWIWLTYSVFFLGLTFLSVRFTEYFVPFVLLFSASALTDLTREIDWKSWFREHRVARSLLPILCMFFLGCSGLQSILTAQTSMAKARDDSVDEAAQWMEENLEEGTVIFHTEWGDFPKLFFYAPHLKFLVGLDPVFMYAHDPGLWRLWKSISDGDRSDIPTIIPDRFHSKTIFLRTRSRQKLHSRLKKDKCAKQIFSNETIAIYELL